MPDDLDRRGGSSRRSAKQTFGIGLAAVLGIVALGLVVLGSTQKQVQIGLIVGGWAAIVGLITVFGVRRHHERDEPHSDVRALEVRRDREVDRQQASAERRRYAEQLGAMLQRELQRVLSDEVGALRDEVAALRSDLVEKVHGQLQLERIETTRVIGSDLEALQHEVRRLAVARSELPPPPRITPAVVTTLPEPPPFVAARTGVAESPVVTSRAGVAEPPLVAAGAGAADAPLGTARTGGGDAPLGTARAGATEPPSADTAVLPRLPTSEQTVIAAAAAAAANDVLSPARSTEPPPAVPAEPSPRVVEDPFAGLPRLGRFQDTEADRPAARPPAPALTPVSAGPDPSWSPPDAGYVGRRRRGADQPDRPPRLVSVPTESSDANTASGRRRRDGESGDDVLGRLLGR